MSADRQVLVVDRADGVLVDVMKELDQLGFRVIWVPTLDAALEFVTANPNLALLVASAAVTREMSPEFIRSVKELAPRVRIIWGMRPISGSSASRASIPVGPIAKPLQADELQSIASRLLTEHFYPEKLVAAVNAAALEVLATVGSFRVAGEAFLIGNETALSDLSAVIPFTGDVSGHVLVSMSLEHARALYHSLRSNVQSPRSDRLEDLLGELCNQILGRINAFLAQHAVMAQHSTPIFIRSNGSTMRYRGRQPSLGVELNQDKTRFFLEYYLDDIDHDKLARKATSEVVGLGEIRYF
jgi:CheY-specific phosphatase CheX